MCVHSISTPQEARLPIAAYKVARKIDHDTWASQFEPNQRSRQLEAPTTGQRFTYTPGRNQAPGDTPGFYLFADYRAAKRHAEMDSCVVLEVEIPFGATFRYAITEGSSPALLTHSIDVYGEIYP